MAVFSQASLQMRRFLYREPRLQTDLSMDFIQGDTVILGACRSLSETGLAGTLFHSVAVGSEGILTLYFEEQSIKVSAVIETPQAEEARIRFLGKEPEEREAVRRLMKLLVKHPRA